MLFRSRYPYESYHGYVPVWLCPRVSSNSALWYLLSIDESELPTGSIPILNNPNKTLPCKYAKTSPLKNDHINFDYAAIVPMYKSVIRDNYGHPMISHVILFNLFFVFMSIAVWLDKTVQIRLIYGCRYFISNSDELISSIVNANYTNMGVEDTADTDTNITENDDQSIVTEYDDVCSIHSCDENNSSNSSVHTLEL